MRRQDNDSSVHYARGSFKARTLSSERISQISPIVHVLETDLCSWEDGPSALHTLPVRVVLQLVRGLRPEDLCFNSAESDSAPAPQVPPLPSVRARARSLAEAELRQPAVQVKFHTAQFTLSSFQCNQAVRRDAVRRTTPRHVTLLPAAGARSTREASTT